MTVANDEGKGPCTEAELPPKVQQRQPPSLLNGKQGVSSFDPPPRP